MCASLGSLLALSVISQPVRADIAPPEFPPGSNIGPEQATNVRMSAEYVLFDATGLTSSVENYVAVSATFTMTNEGSTAEELSVRFPLDCEDSRVPTFNHLSVAVNDIPLSVKYETGDPIILPLPPLYRGPEGDCSSMSWATFPVTFAAGAETIVTVRYDLLPTEISSSAGAFGYILETGAQWQGTIGKAVFAVRLPYPANADNISGEWASAAAFVPKYVENEARWQVENLEPAAKNNLVFRIIYPNVWQKVVDASNLLTKTPDDEQVFIQLGDAYRDSAWEFHGDANQHYLDLSIKAYQRALSVNPYLAKAHSGIARALWSAQGLVLFPLDPKAAFLQPILKHLSLALALEPDNQDANAVWYEIGDLSKHLAVLPTVDLRQLPTLTVTPCQTATLSPQPAASLTPILRPSATVTTTKSSVATASPQSYSTTVPAQDSRPGSGFWPVLSVILVALLGTFLLWLAKRRKS